MISRSFLWTGFSGRRNAARLFNQWTKQNWKQNKSDNNTCLYLPLNVWSNVSYADGTNYNSLIFYNIDLSIQEESLY